jgi:hypothetical protein
MGQQETVVNDVKREQLLPNHSGKGHYSRTCWKPEEVIDRKERKNLARGYVRLKSGSDVLQVGNG